MRKTKRKPLDKAIHKCEQPLDSVSTNTTGPISPPDSEGNSFFQLVVDTASGHTQGFPMKRKAEAEDAILKGIRKIELAVGPTVKLYRSDNA